MTLSRRGREFLIQSPAYSFSRFTPRNLNLLTSGSEIAVYVVVRFLPGRLSPNLALERVDVIREIGGVGIRVRSRNIVHLYNFL
jgi:hypothetical protein